MDAFLRYASTLGMRPPPSKRDGHPSATNTKPGAATGSTSLLCSAKPRGNSPNTTDNGSIVQVYSHIVADVITQKDDCVLKMRSSPSSKRTRRVVLHSS